jgi:hypothetical protein
MFLIVNPIPEKPVLKVEEPKKKNITLPIKVENWYLIEPVISKISMFGKVEVTFPIPIKLIANLT